MSHKETLNTFIYRVMKRDDKLATEIAMKIEEELNRGFSFVISKKTETIVPIEGVWKGWASSEIKDKNIYVYIDNEFFNNHGIIEQILTSLWANLLDFGPVRLKDFRLSKKIHHFLLKEISSPPFIPKNGRPFVGTIYKPSYGLSLKERVEIAEKFAALEGAFIKEDETYFVDKEKILEEAEAIQNSMNKVSSNCYYIPNVTHYVLDDEFLDRLYDIGIRIVMMSYLITGLPVIYKIKRRNKKLIFWGHRVGYKAIKQYISMKSIASLAAYSGLDIIHIGTPLFSDPFDIKERLDILETIRNINPAVLPVFTKVHFDIVEDLIRMFGTSIIIMVCGSIRKGGSINWEMMKKLVHLVKGSKT